MTFRESLVIYYMAWNLLTWENHSFHPVWHITSHDQGARCNTDQ